MADRRTYYANAIETTLAGAMGATDGTASVISALGLIYPTYLVLEPDTANKREYVFVSGAAGNVLTVSERHLAGSAAPSGLTHDIGAVVRQVPLAQIFTDLHDRIDADAVDFNAHDGGNGGHPVVTTVTTGFMSAADKTKLDALDTANQVTGGDSHDHVGGDGAQVDHAGLANLTTGDPHTQYLKEEASGGTAAEVPDHTHASAAQAGTVAHAALTGLSNDEHTQYVTQARHDNEHSALEARRITSDQSIPDSTETQLVYNSVVNESDADGDFSLDTGTGLLTIANAGWYQISASVVWGVVGDGTRRRISIFHNGTLIAGVDEPTSTGITIIQNVGRLKKLAATDTIAVSVFQVRVPAAALAARNDAGTFLTIHRVRSS